MPSSALKTSWPSTAGKTRTRLIESPHHQAPWVASSCTTSQPPAYAVTAEAARTGAPSSNRRTVADRTSACSVAVTAPVSPVPGGVRSAVVAGSCLQRNDWICGEYLSTRADTIAQATAQHVTLTVVSVAVGLVLALPLGVLAFRSPRARSLVLGTSTALYTIPSLAMFSLLLPVTGLTATTVVIGLVLYSLTILVRNVLAGLLAVPREVVESATGMGYSPLSLLLRVQLPLALPALFAGIRVATVSTVALATVGAILGNGGLGNLIYSGLRTSFQAEVLTATVLVVALAVLADLLLLGVQRAVTPWQRSAR